MKEEGNVPLMRMFKLNYKHHWNEDRPDPYAGLSEVEKLKKQNEELNKIGVEVLDELKVVEQDRDDRRRQAEELIGMIAAVREGRQPLDKLYELAENISSVVARPSYQELTNLVGSLTGAIEKSGLQETPDEIFAWPMYQKPEAVFSPDVPIMAVRLMKYALEDVKRLLPSKVSSKES